MNYRNTMLNCLFCKGKKRLYNIYKIYGATERPIKDYIVSFLGSVEEYLREDHGICDACVIILNKLIYIRNAIYQTIIHHSNYNPENPATIKFAAVYKVFLHNLDKLNFEDPEVEENVADLLRPTTRTSPYTDYDSEGEGRLSRANSRSDRSSTPYVDREVASVFKKRKTRARTTSRNGSVEPRAKGKERSKSEGLYDADGKLINKRTRSVSRKQQLEMPTTYYCECCCQEPFKTLSKLTQHKIDEHKLLAKYWCYECFNEKFTSQDDLERHNQLYHTKLVRNCPFCSESMQTKEEFRQHLAEHRLHSVPCNYCDKFFLTGRARFQHIQENHKGAKKQINHYTTEQSSTIIDRIDRSPLSTDTGTPTESVHNFAVKVLIQERAERNCSVMTEGAGYGRREVKEKFGDGGESFDADEVEDGRVGEDLSRDGRSVDDCEEDSQSTEDPQRMEDDQSIDDQNSVEDMDDHQSMEDLRDIEDHQCLEGNQCIEDHQSTEDRQSIEDHQSIDGHQTIDDHQIPEDNISTKNHQPTEDTQSTTDDDQIMEDYQIIHQHRNAEDKTTKCPETDVIANGRVVEEFVEYLRALEDPRKSSDLVEETEGNDQGLLAVHSEAYQSLENFDTGQEDILMDGLDVVEETILETSQVVEELSKEWTAYPLIEKERYAMDIVESSSEGASSHMEENSVQNMVPLSYSTPRKELKVVLDRLVINSGQLAKLNNHVLASSRTRRSGNRSRNMVVDIIENNSEVNDVTVKPKRTSNSPAFNSVRTSRRLSYKLTNHESLIRVNKNSDH